MIFNTYVRNNNSNNNNIIAVWPARRRRSSPTFVGGRSRRWRSVAAYLQLLLRGIETSFSSGGTDPAAARTQIRQNDACLRVCNERLRVKSSTGRHCVSARPSIVYDLRVPRRPSVWHRFRGALVRFRRDVFRVSACAFLSRYQPSTPSVHYHHYRYHLSIAYRFPFEDPLHRPACDRCALSYPAPGARRDTEVPSRIRSRLPAVRLCPFIYVRLRSKWPPSGRP